MGVKEGESCNCLQLAKGEGEGETRVDGNRGDILAPDPVLYFLPITLYYPPIDNTRFVSRNRSLLNLSLVLPNRPRQILNLRFNLLQQIPAPVRSMQRHSVGRVPPLPNPQLIVVVGPPDNKVSPSVLPG